MLGVLVAIVKINPFVMDLTESIMLRHQWLLR